MKRPGLIGLVVAVLLVGGYAIYDYRQANPDPKKKEADSIIASTKEDQVVSFSIISEKQTIELIKDADKWKMLKPIQDMANQIAASDFVAGVVTEKSTEFAKQGDGINWSAYGLDKPKATITLNAKDGQAEVFQVGSAKNFEGNSFIRHNQDNKVLIASSTWFAKADKNIGDFRDLRLMRLPNSKVVKLNFEAENRKFSLTKKNDLWLNMEKMKIRLDQNKVREILGMLNTTNALEFISEKAPSAQDLKAWDFMKPALKLSVQFDDGKTWQAIFSSGKDRIYRVAVSEPTFVLKLSPVDGEKFILADFDSFRDRKEAFQFNRDKVKTIQIKTEQGSKELQNEGDEKIAELIKKIENLNVSSFLPKSNAALKNELVLLDKDAKQLLKLNWGAPQKTKVAGSETSVVEAQSSLVDERFFITEQAMNALKLQDVK